LPLKSATAIATNAGNKVLNAKLKASVRLRIVPTAVHFAGCSLYRWREERPNPRRKYENRREPTLNPSQRTALQLLGLSVGLGIPWGLSLEFGYFFGVPLNGFSTDEFVATWVSWAVQYLVTPLAFYLLGRRDLPNFKTTLGLLTVYAGSLLGEAITQTPFALLSPGFSYLPPFPLTYLADISLNLTFLFVAFSGLSLARLRGSGPVFGRTILALPLLALVFALPVSFFDGYVQLGPPRIDVILQGYVFLGLVLVSGPAQLLVFYYFGKKVSLRGRALRAYGWLFLGAYAGAVIATVAAVGLFGQAQWVASPGTTSVRDGIVYTNMSRSLVTLLEGLNPISSLPFFSFFAVTLPQVGKAADQWAVT
jgi:hypothetical protein